MLRLRDKLGRETNYLVTRSCIQSQLTSWLALIRNTLVSGQATSNHDSLDSSRPGLRGSHHLPPYSILCVAPSHPHPNGFYSRDSQGGVLKLSHFGLPGLWELITPGSDLGLERCLKQTCTSPQELFNGVSHSICTYLGRVDSWLFVVGSQTANLTPGLSFDHNLSFKCFNGPCEAIFDIYTSRPFHRYKEHLKAKCFDLCNRALKLRESQRTPSSHFWEGKSHPHTCPQSGVATRWNLQITNKGNT